MVIYVFFFNDTATTEIYTLSLHDALPIWDWLQLLIVPAVLTVGGFLFAVQQERRQQDIEGERAQATAYQARSEEHTSELQSRQYLVCRLLLEKKKSSQRRSYCGIDLRCTR